MASHRILRSSYRTVARGAMLRAQEGAGGGGASEMAVKPTVTVPPIASKKEHDVLFGAVEGENRGTSAMNPPIKRNDPYFWMRDDKRKDEKILKLLNDENDYTKSVMASLEDKEKELYAELLSHVKETDSACPYPWGEYEYYSRTEEGKSYSIHCRKKRGTDEEEIILNENIIAEGHTYCDVGRVATSPSHRLLAYTVDFVGYETYEVHFVNLDTGAALPDVLSGSDGDCEWGGVDDSTIFYGKMDEAHRPFQLWSHQIGTDVKDDMCLYTEEDELFWLSFSRAKNGTYIIISSRSKETAELHVLPLVGEQKPEASQLRKVSTRELGLRYSIACWKDNFFILANSDGAKNFQLLLTPAKAVLEEGGGRQAWTAVGSFAYDERRTLKFMQSFDDYLVLFGREEGMTQAWILSLDEGKADCVTSSRKLSFPEDAYCVYSSTNKQSDTKLLRISYSSLVQPTATIDVNMETDEREIKKVTEIPNYDPSLYTSARIMAKARDGTDVPISLVYRPDKVTPGTPAPCMLYGYGSYGSCMDPDFNATRLPLLDRGMVYAIAQIRGGSEMGRYWYEEQGKYLTKKNTFNDFIDCAEALIDAKWTTADKLAITGRSAGGLLVGAVLNMRPDLFKVCIAGVPFVDLMTTMCDASIPLTVVEWEEWGNPNEEKYFEYMLSYSPIDNVTTQDYPSILVTAGLNDPRVAYWESLKWVSKLRATKTGESLLLLKTDMSAGHFSASDRYKYLKERAFEYCFLFKELDLLE